MIFKEVGQVSKFDARRGWGFIKWLPFGDNVFVHYSEIRMDGFKALREGDYVMFNVAEGPRGQVAKSVYLLPQAEARAALENA